MLAPMLRFAISLASSTLLFLKLLTGIFRLSDEENHFVYMGDRITRLDLLVDWPEKYFSGQSAERISTLLELVW